MGVTQARFKPKLSKTQDLLFSFFMMDWLIILGYIRYYTKLQNPEWWKHDRSLYMNFDINTLISRDIH